MEAHRMVMEEGDDTSEEWYCPICGRRLRFDLSTDNMIVLEAGDAYSMHYGSKGGPEVHSIEATREKDAWEIWAEKNDKLLEELGSDEEGEL